MSVPGIRDRRGGPEDVYYLSDDDGEDRQLSTGLTIEEACERVCRRVLAVSHRIKSALSVVAERASLGSGSGTLVWTSPSVQLLRKIEKGRVTTRVFTRTHTNTQAHVETTAVQGEDAQLGRPAGLSARPDAHPWPSTWRHEQRDTARLAPLDASG